jgi:hypothetical protein
MNQLHRISAVCAIVLTFILLWASVFPSGGEIVARHHRGAHLISYAMLAFAWRVALARLAWWLVALFVIAFGFMQEGIEVFGHFHPFEVNDALVNALGAIAGVGFAQLGMNWLSRNKKDLAGVRSGSIVSDD